MKITLGKYICGRCGNTFKAPMLDDESSYGEYLLWSNRGHVAYINAIEDEVYNEVGGFIERRYSRILDDPIKVARILWAIFGPVACDFDQSGEPYRIDGGPSCPNCSDGCVEYWEFIYPPEEVDCDIPLVTHDAWNMLAESERIEAIEHSILKYCGNLV